MKNQTKDKSRYVLLPQPVEEEAIQPLKERGVDVVLAPDAKIESVAPLMKRARAVVLRTGIMMTEELLGQSEDLWMISRTGAGVDNVDIKAATKRGVIVTSSIGLNTDSVVEHSLALILSLYKQIPLLDSEVRKGNFGIRYKNLPRDLNGKCLGVVGFGRIGFRVAELCYRMFNMRIIAYDPFLSAEIREKVKGWVSLVSLDDLCSASDVVSIHVPLNEETRGLIGRRHLELMKPDAIIINTSRGGIIDEGALIDALQKGKISGAGLDVFDKEPPDEKNPLLSMDNVILTPHSAALTKECVLKMALSATRRVIDLFDGFVPDNVANPEVLNLPKWKHLRKKREDDPS
ncbi:MAG: hydroxyacid dehydrogenase [Spirochaetota bacterium]